MSQWSPDPWLFAQSVDVLLPALLFGEARGESLQGQMAVANVVRTRVMLTGGTTTAADDPRIWLGVITKPWAFSCFDVAGGNWNAKKTVEFARWLVDPTLIPSQQTKQLVWVASGVRQAAFPDNTAAATHYYVRGTKEPSWAVGRRPVASVDAHDFYKLPEKRFT